MDAVGLLLVIVALLGAGVTYGTDSFAALVWNTSLGRLTNAEMTRVVGYVHYYGDRRLPIPGAIGTVAVVLAAIAAFVAGESTAGALRTAAAVLAFGWLALYVVVAKPINAAFSEAATEGRVLEDAPQQQAAWNRVIVPRVVLQGGVITLLALSLADLT